MPRYSYGCHECGKEYTFKHRYKETRKQCPDCKKEILVKILTTPAVIKYSGDNFPKKNSFGNKTGQVVVDTIEETRAEIKEQKKALKDRKS